ncbi:MAG: hypothetical protein AAF960_20980 [Bacteroidota bacterium]
MEIFKQSKTWITLGIAALALLAFFVYQYGGFKQFDWSMSLDDESEEPYGTVVVKQVLENSIAQDSFRVLDKKINKSLPESPELPSNFIFIGQALLLDTNDVDRLLYFVENGNTAFISSMTIPDLLMDEVFFSPCDTLYWEDYPTYYDTAVVTNFVHPDLRAETPFTFPYVVRNKIQDTYWEQIAGHVFCGDSGYPTVISQSPDSAIVDMIRLPYGDGVFYLQTSPIAFTNFYLTKERGQAYVERAFSHLQDGPIYWDDFSNVPAAVGRRKNWANNNPLEPKQGPLDYVLSQPPLAWAWYLLLTLGLLYLIFRAKRQQRVIPVLEKSRNTSLEFIATIGRMHFSGQNHRRIALQQMDLLQSFIRSKYRLSFEKGDANFAEQLSDASEIDKPTIEKMFLLYTNIKSSNFTSDKTLIELHKLTDYFYKNCR